MDTKQKQNYNKMLLMLKKIAREYQTPDQLRKNSGKQYGLDYIEALEMSYENIQAEAKSIITGMRIL